MVHILGEALIDLMAADCAGTPGFVPRVGGSPFNVAIGLARLGTPSSFLGRTSTDRFGAQLRDHLAAEGVDVSAVPVGPEPTAIAVVDLDEHGHPTYRFAWDATADRQLALSDLPADLGGGALHVGSVQTVLEPGASAVAALVARERGRRAICLDPNVRPQFVDDRAAYTARLEQLVAAADLVKVSDEDLAWLAPEVDPVATARGWLDLGPRLVVLTRGARGAVAVQATGTVEVAAQPVEVVDTVGAGDAFMSGLLAWLDDAGVLEPDGLAGLDADGARGALTFAARVSAITCTRAGADPPRRDEL
jgi:fructokinase